MQNGMKPSPARRLWDGLAPPDSNDEEQLRIGSAVRLLGVGAFVGIVPFLFLEWRSGWVLQVWLLCIIELVLLGALWLNRRGHVRTAALALNATALVCGAALVSMSAEGYRDVSLLLFPAIPVLAGLLLSRSYYWVMSAAAVLVAASLILLQINGLIPYATQTGGFNDLIATVVILMLTSVAVGYLVVALGNSRRLAKATIEALWHHTCVLDDKGMVLAVTRAWGLEGARPPIPLAPSVGINYLDLCEKSSGPNAQETAAFAAGLRAVLRGEQEELAMEYACHSPCEDRCFLTKVRRVGTPGAIRVVIAHEDVTRQRQAELALRLSEARYRGLFEQSPIGIYRTTPDGRVLVANPALLGMLGFDSCEELLMRNLERSGFEPEYQRSEFKERMERDGEVRGLEATWVTRDGRRLSVRENASAVRSPDGQVIYYEGTVEDITARRLAEDESRRTHARLRRILDNLQDGFLQTGPNGRYIMANPSAARMFGYGSAEEMIGVQEESLCANPGERASVLDKLRTQGAVVDYVTQARRRDGTTFWISMSAQMFPTDDGEVVGTEALVRDITDRKLAEEKLRLSEEQHRQLVQNLHAGVVVHGPDTRILLANEQACRLLGLSEEEIRGKAAVDPVWAFFGPDEMPLPLEEYPVNQVLASRSPVRDLVGAVRRPGTEDLVWLLVNAFPELGPRGELRQVVVTFVDITERRHAEEERRKLHENLAQSDRLASMGMMAAGLAHEINNPLAYSLYNLESLCEDLPRCVRQLAFVQQTLADRLGESGLRQALGGHTEALEASVWLDVEARFSDALEGTRRIKDIARRLGTFSRVEKDQVARVELLHPIDSAIGIASNEIKYRATVVREIGPTASVMGSEGRLSQVFLNLLLNAAQSIEEGAPGRNTIRVRTWQEGPTVFAEVQDTGSGIPPENLERIFDPFFTTKPVGVGSGLGLSIVRTILAGYHGTIEAESELGRGTRFLIRLPAAPAEATREPAHVDAEIGVTTSRGRLLVIDDDAGVRKALRRILDGHELIEAESGRQACELLATDQSFDVILCDIGMPNMSGIDVHSWLLELHPRLAQRVVFLTGGAFTPRATAYLEKIQNPQVEKPFDTANLEKLVTDYVRRRGK